MGIKEEYEEYLAWVDALFDKKLSLKIEEGVVNIKIRGFKKKYSFPKRTTTAKEFFLMVKKDYEEWQQSN